MTDQLTIDAAAEDRQEQAEALFQAYRTALVAAQASHDPDDWLKAGSLFKRYAAAAVAVERRGSPAELIR